VIRVQVGKTACDRVRTNFERQQTKNGHTEEKDILCCYFSDAQCDSAHDYFVLKAVSVELSLEESVRNGVGEMSFAEFLITRTSFHLRQSIHAC
jgi:hypothetical protein